MMKIFRHLTFSLLALFVISCDNDDSSATNATQCDFSGFSYVDSANQDQILIADSDIQTQFFPNASNGPFGMPGFEIVSNSGTSPFFFTTNVIIMNQTGIGMLSVNNGPSQTVTVTCQRAGATVGDELRLDVVIGSIEVEFCVAIDEVVL